MIKKESRAGDGRRPRLDDFAAGDIARGRCGTAAGPVASGFKQAVAADAAADGDFE